MGDDDLDEVLRGVGPRLRELRRQRDQTLAELAEATGISVSTLSRLESGSRRASLELLLPIARAHQVPLDELVAPVTEDPRIRARSFEHAGMTFLPLTRRPGGLQAYRQVIPAGLPAPAELGSHEGYEWFYVLEGRVRLLLGQHDLVLQPGEVAEFDTRTPHALLNPGPGSAAILSLYGPQGERMHVRARPRPASAG